MAKKRKQRVSSASASSSGRDSPPPSPIPQPPVRALWRRMLHWGPLMASGVTGEISIAGIYCHLLWWSPLDSGTGAMHLCVFVLFTWLTLYYLINAAYMGPGYVPLGWRPDSKSDERKLQYCQLCSGFKSPRSHHCRKCNRCVMKMDHHCPWINNCCGYRNQGAFTKFLLSAVIGCLQATVILGCSIYRAIFRVWYLIYGTGREPIVELGLYGLLAAIFGFGLAVGVILAVGFLFVVQMRAILKNSTGIEDYISSKAQCRDRETPFVYPYYLGKWEDFKQVFTWNGKPKGDGYWWPVVDGCDQFTLTLEQLHQKEEKRQRARPYIITRAYSGRIVTCWNGILTFCCQPYTEEKRIAVKPGQQVLVTRGMKYWFYGELLVSEGDGDAADTNVEERRGWFPRSCARKLTDVVVVNGIHNNDKKEQ